MTRALPMIMPTLIALAIVLLIVAGFAGFVWLLKRTGDV